MSPVRSLWDVGRGRAAVATPPPPDAATASSPLLTHYCHTLTGPSALGAGSAPW
jgi:hypothetical protein